MTSVFDRFTEWWERAGRLIGGDRKLAAAAWEAAFSQSGNYVADNAMKPRRVTFANERVVSAWLSDGSAYLKVGVQGIEAGK